MTPGSPGLSDMEDARLQAEASPKSSRDLSRCLLFHLTARILCCEFAGTSFALCQLLSGSGSMFLSLDIINFPSQSICLLEKAQLRYSRWGPDPRFLMTFHQKTGENGNFTKDMKGYWVESQPEPSTISRCSYAPPPSKAPPSPAHALVLPGCPPWGLALGWTAQTLPPTTDVEQPTPEPGFPSTVESGE